MYRDRVKLFSSYYTDEQINKWIDDNFNYIINTIIPHSNGVLIWYSETCEEEER